MSSFHLQIVTPDGLFFDGEALSLDVRTPNGGVTILPRHINYVTPLGMGVATVRTEERTRRAACIGGMLAGLGGLYFVMEYTGGTWVNNGFGDRGWLAIALVIFARWRPLSAIWGSMLFGGLYILYLYVPGLDRSMQEIFKALPYLVTIIVLVLTSLRKKREDQPPAGLGSAYFRESRG